MDRKTASVSPLPRQDVDRISNLPNEILSHILSYLSTEDSVRTRILSTRWKYVFTLVPVLDFICPPNCCTPSTVQHFLDFVSFVFNSYNVGRMERFVYSSSSFLPESEAPRLASWIEDSVNRGVREITVIEILIKPQMLPQNVLTSKTLTFLKLSGNFKLDFPENVELPCLRTLDLLSVAFPSEDSLKRLFRSCPVLEDLFLDHCNTENSQVIDICVPLLLSLKIHGIEDEYELVLDVPNVKYFEYLGYKCRGFTTRDGLKSLAKASVSFQTWSFAGFEALRKLVSIVCHVQHLVFDTHTLECLRRFGMVLPTFQNLTSLDVGVSDNYDFDFGILLGLLDKTPHLEVLVLDNINSYPFNEPSVAVPEHVPTCVSKHIKVIEFRRFSMMVYELTLLQYFLKNAKLLLRLSIQTNLSLEEQFEINKKVLAFSMCSRDCQIFLRPVDEGRK